MQSRARFVTGALFGISALAALLAGDAFLTARYHRVTAERVLADYAALGAEGVATRLLAPLAGRLYPPLGALRGGSQVTRTAIAEGLSGPARELAGTIRWAVRIGPSDSIARAPLDSAPSPPDRLVPRIRDASHRLPETAYFGTLILAEELIVFSPLRAVDRAGVAYGIPVTEIGEIVTAALARDPLLPRSLSRGEDLSRGIGVTLVAGSRPIASRGRADSTGFRAVEPLGALFPDFAIEFSIGRDLAATLIIGGLPRSRLPVVLAILGLALGLAATAAAQLRQERQLARLREDFIAGASHELRTPLAQIRLFAETLRLGRIRSAEEATRSVAVIEREARRLEHLIENLLHFSRAERGLVRVTRARSDLGHLTRDICGEFEPLAAKGGVRLTVHAPADLVAEVDPSGYRQLLLNLLDNAVKYGGSGSTVAIDLAREDDSARLSVTDQGEGVPQADRDRVWDRFWRGETARSAGVPGTGIGLATVRDLVRLHAGSCWVEPADPRGARFVVRLPV